MFATIPSTSKSTSFDSTRKVFTLPRVEHPTRRVNAVDQQTLDIRGNSQLADGRAGGGDGQLIRNESPGQRYSRFSSSSSTRKSSLSRKSSSRSEQVRLPIFGYGKDRRRSTMSTERQSMSSSPLHTADYVEILREKVSRQRNEIERKFRQMSVGGHPSGRLSRPAVRHLVSSIFGVQMQISPEQIDAILNSFQLKDQHEISFSEFLRGLNLNETRSIDRIVEESSRSSSSSSFSSATDEPFLKPTAKQMFHVLKDKIQSKSDDLLDFFPSMSMTVETSDKAKLYRNEFQQNLIRLGFHLEESQFKKLWKRFDPDGFHSIELDRVLHVIRHETFEGEHQTKQLTSETQDQQKAILNRQLPSSALDMKTPRLSTVNTDLTSKQIQLWILHKFPHGFADLEKSLAKFDLQHNGVIRRDEFHQVFRSFGFHLEGELFPMFFQRLNLSLAEQPTGSIHYPTVLRALKQRVATTQLSKQVNRILSTSDEPIERSLLGQIEYLIRSHFERVERQLKALDTSGQGKISADQWKVFLEDLVEFALSPDEFHRLKKSFPRDPAGQILWKDFLRQIRKSSSDDHRQVLDSPSKIPDWEYMRSKNIRERLDLQHLDKQRSSQTQPTTTPTTTDTNHRDNRSIEQLHHIVKRLIRHRYKEVEEQFHQLDQLSYGELSKDLLFQLFHRLSVEPSIVRGEVDLIWSRCHLKENGKLDFYQFLREFGYSKRSAHYPNAKQNPPKRGDADFLLTSRKLYGDSVLVHGAALNAIRSNWNELRREFGQLDPHRTGFIQTDEFDDILIDLCPAVNHEDLEILTDKFQSKHDSRTNYIRFLKYHSPLASLNEEMSSSSDRHHSHQLKNKIRSKVAEREKGLRRSLVESDRSSSGGLSVGTLKKVFEENHCHLTGEEFSFVLSQLDVSADGLINSRTCLQRLLH